MPQKAFEGEPEERRPFEAGPQEEQPLEGAAGLQVRLQGRGKLEVVAAGRVEGGTPQGTIHMRRPLMIQTFGPPSQLQLFVVSFADVKCESSS